MLHKPSLSVKITLLFLFLASILLVFMFNPFKKFPKDLFGIDEKFAFSKDAFWESIVDSFSFTDINTQSFKGQTFDGSLEENHVYKATWPIEDKVLRKLPYHHAFNIEWKNIADFPQLKNSGEFMFRVISKKTYKVSNQYRWNNEYVCEIVNVQKP